MKSLFILFVVLLLVTPEGFGQDERKCSELIVSEIVFSGDGSGNYAVEIFNPTESNIDLSNYKIELLPEQGTGTAISLSDTIPSEGVIVVTTRSPISEIATVADIMDDALSFENKSVLQLVKGTNTVIDRIGNQGIGTNVSQIDLTQLLNDPTYIDGLNINLSSIKNIVVRRRKVVQQGKSDFENVDIFNEWVIYPNLDVSHLGEHTNACLVPTLSWKNWSQFLPEDERWEWDATPVDGIIQSTDPLPEDVDVIIVTSGHFFTTPFALPATQNDDYLLSSNINVTKTLLASPTVTEYEFELATVVDDFIQDNFNGEDEGVGFLLALDFPTMAVDVDDDANVFDLLIKEDETNSTTAVYLSSQIEVSPVVVSDFTRIEVSDPEVKIEQVAVVSLDCKRHELFQIPNTNLATIDLSSIQAKGYYLLMIKTNKGITMKKIIKG